MLCLLGALALAPPAGAHLVHLESYSAECRTFSDCSSCASAKTWMPGSSCRWCPADLKCHPQGAFGWSACHYWENIKNVTKCAGQPGPPPLPPAPPPVPQTQKFVADLMDAFFDLVDNQGFNVGECMEDVGGSTVYLRDFAQDAESGRWRTAVNDLGRGLAALANSLSGCKVPQIQQKLNILAAGTRWSDITEGVGRPVAIIVGATDVWQSLWSLKVAVKDENAIDTAEALNNLLDAWTSVKDGCDDDDLDDNKACRIIDGLLRVMAETATKVAPCVTSMGPIVQGLETAAKEFAAEEYEEALAGFGESLGSMSDKLDVSCGLDSVAEVLEGIGPDLKAAQVSRLQDGTVQVMVGSANVYLELFGMSKALYHEDYEGAGVQLGLLIAKMLTKDCQTKACLVMTGMMISFNLGFPAVHRCHKDLDGAWASLSDFTSNLQLRRWPKAMKKLGDFLGHMAHAAPQCGVETVGALLGDTARKLDHDVLAREVGVMVQFLVGGADVAHDMQKMIVHVEDQDWSGLGHDLAGVSMWISGTECTSFVCRVLEGIMQGAGMVLIGLEDCEKDLRKAEESFTAGTHSWAEGDLRTGVKYWASALHAVSLGVSDCGIKSLSYYAQESNVLGLANVTAVGATVNVLVHGTDFYAALYGSLEDIGHHDYRAAGAKMGTVLSEMNNWTQGSLCSSGACYIVNGAMQYLGDLEGDARRCKADIVEASKNFFTAVELIVNTTVSTFRFSNRTGSLKEGIQHMGKGMHALADAVRACDLAVFANMFEKLALKFGLQAHIGWVGTLLHILIDGVDIMMEMADACQDYIQRNWPSFGYNLAKLSRKLLFPKAEILELPLQLPLPEQQPLLITV